MNNVAIWRYRNHIVLEYGILYHNAANAQKGTFSVRSNQTMTPTPLLQTIYATIRELRLVAVAGLNYFQGDLFDQRVSPLSTVDAVVVREGRILLIKRHDNGLWALPGGLVEVNQTLTEAALRELEEETGIQGHIIRLLGIFDSRLWESQEKVHLHHTIFLVDGAEQLPKATQEAVEVGFFGDEELPALSPGHHRRVPFIFKLLRGEAEIPHID